jgi:hypothetical protein
LLGTAGVESVVADFFEARRQDVCQEAPRELAVRQRAGFAVAGSESDVGVRDGSEPGVANADAVGVAAEVGEDVVEAPEGGLGVNDPALFCRESFFESGKRDPGGELDDALLHEASESTEQSGFERGFHASLWEEESAIGELLDGGSARVPSVGTDDAVCMDVIIEISCPCVEDDGDAELSADGVLSEVEEP